MAESLCERINTVCAQLSTSRAEQAELDSMGEWPPKLKERYQSPLARTIAGDIGHLELRLTALLGKIETDCPAQQDGQSCPLFILREAGVLGPEQLPTTDLVEGA